MKKTVSAVVMMITIIMLSASIGDAATAVITELKKGKGTVEFRKAGQESWQPALPLQALGTGDQLRAAKDGFAVIVYASGGGTFQVDASNSPFEVRERQRRGEQGAKARQVFQSVAGFLVGKKTTTLSAPMSVRTISRPPAIISPKDTKIFSGVRPVFEWVGPPRVYYRIKVSSPAAVLWTSEGISRTHVAYPDSAPPFVAGGFYIWEIETSGFPTVTAEFAVASAEEEQALIHDVALLSADLEAGQQATASVLKYGLLAQQGFYAEARQEVLKSLATDPDEPSLHLLLAEYYRHVGLKDLATEEADEADFLLRVAP